MAIINYIPSVKTSVGFDTLNTVSTFINHTATGVFTNGDTYEINIPAPDEILTGQFSLIFVPDSDSIAGMKISINNGVGIPIDAGGSPLTVGALKTGVATELLVDVVEGKAYSIDGAIEVLGESNLTEYNRDVISRDINGNVTEVQYKRPSDTSLFLKRTYSNPDVNGFYQTVTEQFYLSNGTTIYKTSTYTLSYFENGIIDTMSRVVV